MGGSIAFARVRRGVVDFFLFVANGLGDALTVAFGEIRIAFTSPCCVDPVLFFVAFALVRFVVIDLFDGVARRYFVANRIDEDIAIFASAGTGRTNEVFRVITRARIGGFVVYFIAIACFFQFARVADLDITAFTNAGTCSANPVRIGITRARIRFAIVSFFRGMTRLFFDANAI